MIEEGDWDDQRKDREIEWRYNRSLNVIREGEEDEEVKGYCEAELTSAIKISKS
jgi:hypothetical protein